MYEKSTKHFLVLDWLAILEYIYIYIFGFDILNFSFFYVQKLVTGLTVRESDQIYEILR